MSRSTLTRTVRTFFCIGLCLASIASLAASSAPHSQQGAPQTHAKVYKWMTDAGAKTVPATDFPLVASPPLSLQDRRLVRLCLARYGYPDLENSSIEAMKSAERIAKLYLDAMPRTEIARRLVPIRKALSLGGRAYTSVSFVLAYYDIDFEQNALRVVEPFTFREVPTKLKRAGLKQMGDDYFDWTGYMEAGSAIGILYRRHPSAKLLRAYLHLSVRSFLE